MKSTTLTIILVAAILVFLNLVAGQYYFRWDLTEDKQYSLSSATRDILREMNEPVTVKAYFSENLTPAYSRAREDFLDYLVEYNRLSGGNVVYEFIDPNASEALEQEAAEAGIQPVMINLRERDEVKVQRAYMGAVLELGEQREVIPFIQPGAAVEYALSTAIKKMTVTEKPVVGFVQGHGEAAPAEMAQVVEGLSILNNVEPVTLADTLPVPGYIRTLALVRPTDSIPPTHLAQLDAFLQRGGQLFVAMNRVDGNLQNAFGSEVSTGLEGWLAEKGINVDASFLTDINCAAVTVTQQQGMFRLASEVQFPYLPIISNFADHPATQGLEAVVMQFASPVSYAGDSSATFTPLAFSSAQSGSQPAPLYFDVQRQWTEQDFPLSGQAVAGVLNLRGQGRLLVVGDGDFPINGPMGQQRQLSPDNINLMVNAIDWLSDDTGLIALRTKGIQYRPLDEVEAGTRTLLKYLNFFLPLLLLGGYGLLRSQLNRKKRKKRMEEDYV